MQAAQTSYQFDVLENSSYRLSGQFADEDGNPIVGTAVQTLTVTLYAQDDITTIINGRDNQDILNANNGVVGTGGDFQWYMQPADNPILDTSLTHEYHTALFEWTWDRQDGNGIREQRLEVVFVVQNLSNVP